MPEIEEIYFQQRGEKVFEVAKKTPDYMYFVHYGGACMYFDQINKLLGPSFDGQNQSTVIQVY